MVVSGKATFTLDGVSKVMTAADGEVYIPKGCDKSASDLAS
jgi:hypothetical protein